METTQSTDTKASAPKLDLDELMERIRAEVAERKRQSNTAALFVPAPVMPDPGARNWSVQEILALPLAEFVRAVHLAFLGREPSPDEFVRVRDRLLAGHAGRMRILREFRSSLDARERRRSVAGFWRASAGDRIYWSPPAKAGRSIGRAVSSLWNTRRRVREYIARLETVERRTAETASALRTLQSAEITHVRQLKDQLAATKQALDNTIAMRAGNLEQSLAVQARETATELAARFSEIQTRLVDHWRAILDFKLRTEAFLTSGPSGTIARDTRTEKLAGEKAHLLDPLYLSFEDRYRGTRLEIKDRQRVYLPLIKACVAETGGGPVIDVGCGRGEWLELLGESGITARGYDLNRIAVEECRGRGLSVEEADARDIMSALADNSCAAITAFHVIEHIGLEALVCLLDEALRVLRSGGLIVLETPNPANLVVAAEKFYFDPTHRNPVPSELTDYLLKARGFGEIEVVPLHPVEWASRRSYDDPMLALLQDKLFGPQDYAAIGRKPG
ncbi:MAG TPA: class I SAM-dependent methyltransferase [Rhizomicrobium sp.]|jgi:O-antigen chain-terminating methyltransferase